MGFYGNTTYEVIETIPTIQVKGTPVSPDLPVEIQGDEKSIGILIEHSDSDNKQIIQVYHLESVVTGTDVNATPVIEFIHNPENVPQQQNAININFGDQLCVAASYKDERGHVTKDNAIYRLLTFPTLSWEVW